MQTNPREKLTFVNSNDPFEDAHTVNLHTHSNNPRNLHRKQICCGLLTLKSGMV